MGTLEGSGCAERQEGFAAVVTMNTNSKPLQEGGLGESTYAAVGREWDTPGHRPPTPDSRKVGGYQEGTLARSQPSPGLSEPAPPDKHGWLLTAGAKEIKPKAPWREDRSGLYALAHSNPPPVCPFLSCCNITHLGDHRGTQLQLSKGRNPRAVL